MTAGGPKANLTIRRALIGYQLPFASGFDFTGWTVLTGSDAGNESSSPLSSLSCISLSAFWACFGLAACLSFGAGSNLSVIASPSTSISQRSLKLPVPSGWNSLPPQRLITGHIRKGCRMVEKHNGRIVETATEARQAEPGPSIFLVLVVSVVLAVTILGVVWFMFFKT
jgi:hypothetical protein